MTEETTRKTYDKSAQIFSDYFATHGARTVDIEKAIMYLNNKVEISALELGCGDGRDGVGINKSVTNYEGIDYSKGMIAIANKKHPELNCRVANMLNFEYPQDQDIIFAFASLLHLNKDQVKEVINKCSYSLKPGGILAVSLKYRPKYSSDIKVDRAGDRQFFFYTPELILELCGGKYVELYKDFRSKTDTKWFFQILQKK
ncbi:MAG: class I SAM-dependent methyltransferase [Candidatus Saccharibacteria bacterium]